VKVLVACEFSGIVRDAFIARGHDAVSCDLLPTERPGPHIIGNVFNHLDEGWDMMLCFWPCTYAALSGVRWLYSQVGRWEMMEQYAKDFRRLVDYERIPKRVMENPIPHRHARNIMGKYTQIIQPWQFGHGETKATCLWLFGVPLLKPTAVVSGRIHRVHLEPPGPDRQKNRSRTYPGIANAMAEQWG